MRFANDQLENSAAASTTASRSGSGRGKKKVGRKAPPKPIRKTWGPPLASQRLTINQALSKAEKKNAAAERQRITLLRNNNSSVIQARKASPL